MRLPDQVDTVLLDMDGTLLDLHFDEYFWLDYLPRRYAEVHDEPHDVARDRLLTTLDATRGRLEWYCTDHWSRTFALDIMSLKREVAHLIRYRPEARGYLERLQASHRRALLVTNAHPDVLALKQERTGVTAFVDAVVTSHDYGHAKEDPRFWEALHAAHAFDPDRTVLVDDSQPVLRAAERFGIAHVRCIAQPDMRSALRTIDDFPAITRLTELE